MQKIAVMTDSNCGMLPDKGKKLGISIVPMPVIIDGTTYYEGVDITAEEFYKRQAAGAEIHLVASVAGRCDGYVGSPFERT